MSISFKKQNGKDVVVIYNTRTQFTIPLNEYLELWNKT